MQMVLNITSFLLYSDSHTGGLSCLQEESRKDLPKERFIVLGTKG